MRFKWVFKCIDLVPGFESDSTLPSVFQLRTGRWIYILQVPQLPVWLTYLYTRSWYYYNGIISDFREQRRSIRKCHMNYEFFRHDEWRQSAELWVKNSSVMVIMMDQDTFVLLYTLNYASRYFVVNFFFTNDTTRRLLIMELAAGHKSTRDKRYLRNRMSVLVLMSISRNSHIKQL